MAEKLNPAAFEKGWKLWAAEDGENAKPYPLFSEQNANELVLVKLQPYVKFGMNSELFGKVTFAGGGTSALAKVDTKLTLQADGGMAAFYTTESEKQDSYTTTDGLKQFSEAYVVNKSDGGKVVTLYYGSANDFTATALERAFYYDALNYTIKSITYKDENDENKTASAEEVFQTFAGLVNKGVDFKGKTVNLGADIDLSDIEWTPVGTADHPFRGIFTGGTSYYTISGLKVNGDFANAGLFGVVDGGTIQYVTITDSTKTEETADESGETTPVEKTIPAGNVNGKGNTGSIVGWLKSGKVESCMSTATVKGSGNTGGLVGLVGAETVGETAFVGTVNGSYYYNEARVGVPAAGKVLEGSAINKSFYLAETSTFGNTANENGENGDTGARTAEEFAAGRVAWELKSSTNSKWGCTDDLRPCLGSSVKPMELKVSARDAMPVGVTLEIQLSDKNSGDMLRQLNDDDGTVYAYVKQYANVTMSWTLSGPTETQVMFEPSDKVRQREGSSGCVYVSDNVSIQYYFIGADISWYNEETIAKKAYTIKTPAELNGLALLVNGKVGKNETFEGWTLTLGNDISLKGYDWTPIGSSYSFEGVFDGSGHSITDLQIDVTLNSENDHGPWGLFGKLGDTTGNASAKATIKNLTVDGSVTVIGKQIGCNVGGIVGYIYKGATVEHCHNLANVTAEAWYRKLGRNDSSTEPRAGGIAGYNEGGTITNCLNEGAVTIRGTDLYSQMYAGGIVGKASNGSVEYCWNYGTVDASGVTLKANAPTYFSRFVSGIAGSGTVLNCANFGMVKTGNGIPASGIGGMVTNSYNMGSVTGPEDKVYSISKERTVNSYTIDLTANTGVYVKNSAGTTDADKSQPITITPDADGKNTTYTIDEKPLVDVLNEACTDMSITGACLWTNKVDAPWNPVHVTQWNGEDVPGAPGKVTVTYYSNMTGSDTGKVDSAVLKDSKSHTFTLKTADELNFRNENGRFMGWALSAEGAVAYPYKDGKFTSAKEVTVNEAERNVNLYAVWEQLWTGTGTEVDPYKINDLNDLKKLQTQVNEGYYQYADKWFALTADSLTLDLMSTGKPTTLENGGDFHLGEANAVVKAEFTGNSGGGGGYYYGGTGDGTGTGDKDDEGLQDGLNMDVEYDIKGLVLGAYAEWGSNGGNKSFQKWLEENPNVVRALLTNSLDNMATAAVGKKTDEAKDLAALLLASLNEHTGVDGKDGDTIAKALQKYIDSGSEEVFSAWLTGGGGMASGTYESIYGQYASSLAALADRLYSKWEASGTSMTFPVWLDSQQVSMDSLSENADEPDTDNTNDPQTSDAPDDVPDGQDTEGGASGNSVWEIIGTVVRENPILVWSIVAVIAALIIVGAVRRYHKVKRDEHDEK